MKQPLPIAAQTLSSYLEQCECGSANDQVAALIANLNTTVVALIEIVGKDMAAFALVDAMSKLCGVDTQLQGNSDGAAH